MMGKGGMGMTRRWDDFDDWASPRRPRRSRWLAFAVLAAVCYGLGLATGSLAMPRTVTIDHQVAVGNTALPAGTPQAGNQPLPPALNSNIITQIYNRARPSVVTITAVTHAASKNAPEEDIGTGFFIDDHGDIATNNHVVNGQKTVSVTVGDKTYKGTVIGNDPMDDLAIVRISPPPNVPPLTLGTAKTLQPGDLVVAIGNPFELTASVSAGIVSGLNRSMQTDSGRMMSGLVQTDAALNPGNSGGPLLDAYGRVVGINTAIESPVEGSVGIGFAIPIDRLVQLLPRLMNGQKVEHAWIGITALDIRPSLVDQYHLPVQSGVLVISTVPGGPAAKAGIQGDSSKDPDHPVGDGDIIVAINGQPVHDVAELTSIVTNEGVGAEITLSILRHGKPMDVKLKLEAWPSEPPK
jgi:S1-C subfamily serine protease